MRINTDHPNRAELERLAASSSLNPLDRAKCLRWLGDGRAGNDDLHDAIASRVGTMDRATRLRYLRALKMPAEIQQAFGRGELGLVQVGRIREEQADVIASRIEDGEAPADVVAEYIRPPELRRKSPNDSLEAILDSIIANMPLVAEHRDLVLPFTIGSPKIAKLKKFMKLAEQLLARPQVRESKMLRELRQAHAASQKVCVV